MEREGRGRREGEREMRKGRRGIIAGGIILGLLFGCNNGIAELEKKNSFYESVVKIGQGFQEIFGNFGNAIGDVLGGGKLGFDAVKSDDNRDKVGAHFDKVKEGLEGTNGKLKELSGKMSQAKNADTKGVEDVISSASEVIGKLITSVTKLSGVTKAAGKIGDSNNGTAAVAANKQDVQAVIDSVKEIIKAAEDSGLKISKIAEGKDGNPITASNQTSAPAALGGTASGSGAGVALADEVAKADSWAMIDKIRNSKVETESNASNNDSAGELATANASGNNGAATKTADLAAAVALKAMTQTGKFSHASNEEGAVKAAAASAVNKVLGVLNVIIRETVSSHLEKVREAVMKIQYSENTGTEATEAKK